MRRSGSFLDVFLRGGAPSTRLLLAFALGLLVIGLVSNLSYDLLTEPAKVHAAGRPLFYAVLGLTGVAYLLYWLDQRQRTVRVIVDDSLKVPAYPHLLWVLGPGSLEHLVFALNHHQSGGGATDLWLLWHRSDAVERAYQDLTEHLAERGLRTRLHEVALNQLSAGAAYEAVQQVTRQIGANGPLIVDITGGLKPLTAGVVLGALTTNSSLEYVASNRDALGRPIAGSLQVVQVDTRFYIS